MAILFSPGRSVFFGGLAAAVLALNHFGLLDTMIAQAGLSTEVEQEAFSADHPLFIEAEAEAKRYLPRFIAKAVKNPADWESAAVKVDFVDGALEQTLWVENFTKVQGDLFAGTLVNGSQQLTDMPAGKEVTFRKAQIADWSFVHEGQGYGYFSVHAELPVMTDARAKIMQSFLADAPVPKGW